MDQELKKKWLENLRGGKYKKGRCMLRSSQDKFCCLGVLCDIVNPNNWRRTGSRKTSPWGYSFTGHENTTAYLPFDLRDIVGVNSEVCGVLASINDKNYTFDNACEYIEKNL